MIINIRPSEEEAWHLLGLGHHNTSVTRVSDVCVLAARHSNTMWLQSI